VVEQRHAQSVGLRLGRVERHLAHHLEPGPLVNARGVAARADLVGQRDHPGCAGQLRQPRQAAPGEQGGGRRLDHDQVGVGPATPGHEGLPGATGQVADDAPPRAREIVEHALEAEVLSGVLPARPTRLAELEEVDAVRGPRGVLLHHLGAAAPTGQAEAAAVDGVLLDDVVGQTRVDVRHAQREGQARHGVGIQGEHTVPGLGEDAGERPREGGLPGTSLAHERDAHVETPHRPCPGAGRAYSAGRTGIMTEEDRRCAWEFPAGSSNPSTR